MYSKLSYLIGFLLSIHFCSTAQIHVSTDGYMISYVHKQKKLTKRGYNSDSEKRVFHLNAQIEQLDDWSCGYRVLFHIDAIEKALSAELNFSKALKKSLSSTKLLKKMYALNGNAYSSYGISDSDIMRLSKKMQCDSKVCVVTESHGKVFLINGSEFSHRKNNLKRQVSKMIEALNVQPSGSAHIVCLSHCHWILCSFVKRPNKPLSLYIIDSLNRNGKKYKPFVRYLKRYL